MSLEVDGTKIAIPHTQEEKVHYDNHHDQAPIPQYGTSQSATPQYMTPQHGISQYAPLSMSDQVNDHTAQADGRISRLRRMNTLLLIAFVSALIAAIVAAAVGGSLAANRQNQIASLQNQLATTSNGTTSAPSNNTAPLPANNTAPLGPISNCTSFTSAYTAPRGNVFTIHCGNDLTGGSTPDILGIYVYTFADCINACSSYNMESARAVEKSQTRLRPNGTCAAVSWNRALTRAEGNCWLKAAIQASLSVNATVDTATLNS